MKFNTIDDLKAAGFEGFIPVAQLQADSTAIPRTAGVYMVVYTGENIPEFLSRGTGGFFKGKDPNVSITELETNWVENSGNLLLCWKPTPDEDPETVETALIARFKEQHGGHRPFANLKD